MAFSNDDALFSRGMELYRSKNPVCIQIFKECNDNRSRAQLAKIYFEGSLKIKKNYDTALDYTANNDNFLAVSIECEIRVFERKEVEYYSIAFSRLSEACSKYQKNTHMNELLSRMLLQGLGTEPNYLKACQLNTQLKYRNYFRFQAKYCNDEIKNKLIAQFETMVSDNPEYYSFIGDMYGLMRDFDKGYDYYLKALDAGISLYSSVIIYNLKIDRPLEALKYANEWYAAHKCPASASALADVNIALENPLSDYIDILDEFKDDPTCLRKELHATYVNGMNEAYEELIMFAIQQDVPAYDAMARYYLSLADYNHAIEYFQKDYDYSNDYERWRIGESATNLFTCIHDTKGECDKSLAHTILKYGKPKDLHHVGCILVSESNSEFKILGKKLLDSASYGGFEKSTVKLLEISRGTEDNASLDILNSRLQNDTSNRYIFNSNDKTEIIEDKYDSLPASYRLNALVELSKRYYYGNKHTIKDGTLASKYIELYLTDADRELDRRYSMMNALRGAIMYKDHYPEENDVLAFQLMYPCRNILPILNYVAEAQLTGRGTDMNVDEGIALLKSCRHCNCIRYLSAYYEKGKYVDANPDTSFEYAKSLILEFDPEKEDIERFIRLLDLIGKEPTSIDASACVQKKAAFLFHQAANENDTLLQLRLYDFSRKLGNVKAACKEANIICREYCLPKVAYSILSEYNDDEVCITLLKKYPERDRTIVDFESELNILFNSKKGIKFLLDGVETEILDSYDSTFFMNRNSFEISQVFFPIIIEVPELNFISNVLSPNKENIVSLDIIIVNKLLILTDKLTVHLIVKVDSTNEQLTTTSINCSGSYELIGTSSLMSRTIFKTRFHLEGKNGLMKTQDQLIEKTIVDVNTSGFDKIVIEEERTGIWIQCYVLYIPNLRIDPDGEYFLKIYKNNKIIGFQKNCFSGYVDDGPLIECLDTIIETKIGYEDGLSKEVSIRAYVRDARERIMDYICKQKDPAIVNRIARIKQFDESFAYDLYTHAMKQGKDVAIAKNLFPSYMR